MQATDLGQGLDNCLRFLWPQAAEPLLHVLKHKLLNARSTRCIIWVVEGFEDLEDSAKRDGYIYACITNLVNYWIGITIITPDLQTNKHSWAHVEIHQPE